MCDTERETERETVRVYEREREREVQREKEKMREREHASEQEAQWKRIPACASVIRSLLERYRALYSLLQGTFGMQRSGVMRCAAVIMQHAGVQPSSGLFQLA